MGKGQGKARNKHHRDAPVLLPFVSLCTPTYNRRPFIEQMLKCFEHQTYPKDRMEWIIIDDGTDKIRDMIQHIPQIKYFAYDEKMTLGRKRNLMHDKTKGEIIVYMDDDDYYPPARVSHAVDTLLKNPTALCAGSSEMYIYFRHIEKMYQFGPYGPNHATAGTFAMRKKILGMTKYNEDASLAEEKQFLKNYTIPFAQLNPLKTILVFSHDHNTFDKRVLLEGNPDKKYTKESDKKITDFIENGETVDFFLNKLPVLLSKYEPGHPSMKPDVLKQIKELTEEREKMYNNNNNNNNNNIDINSITVTIVNEQTKESRIMTLTQIMETLHEQNKIIAELRQMNEVLMRG